jgi:tyrosinase
MATGAPSTRRVAVPVRHRPNVEEMTPQQVGRLRAAFRVLQTERNDDRGYQHHAGHHGLPLPPECRVAHGQPAFLPWHRAYLHRFEQALRDTGHDVMLPWWDWTRTRTIPRAFAERQSPDGTPNPLYSARIPDLALAQGLRSNEPWTQALARAPDTVRAPGRPPTRLPTAGQIDYAIRTHAEYEAFRMDLEDYHGNVHMWVGGHMSSLAFSSYDPIFWAHHCMIDRLWRIWQLRHPEASFPTALRSQAMTPFNLTAGRVLDPTRLGYDYAISIAQVRVPA